MARGGMLAVLLGVKWERDLFGGILGCILSGVLYGDGQERVKFEFATPGKLRIKCEHRID